MTNHWTDIKNADLVLIMGGNAAEAHPCGFKWVTEAKAHNKARLLVVDPRFTRSASVADYYAPIRTGTDIAFLGGLINYLLENDKIQHEYVRNYTDVSFIVKEGFSFEDGLFNGYDAEKRTYPDKSSWGYEIGEDGYAKVDPTLTHPRCVFNLLKQHYSRYTPDVVSNICGTPKDMMLKIWAEIAETSKPGKVMTIMYALGWTQHSVGAQMIRTGAMVQLLLGNIGMPGGGMNALRGHSNIQGLTDLGLLSNSLPGYLTLAMDAEQDYDAYIAKRTAKPLRPGQLSYWQNYGKFHVSLMKAWFGKSATKENNWCYDWLPKLDMPGAGYDVLRYFDMMYQGKVNGYFCQGFNPIASFPNKAKVGAALARLQVDGGDGPAGDRDLGVLAQRRRVQRRRHRQHQDHGVPPAHLLLRRGRRLDRQQRPLVAVALEGRRTAGPGASGHRHHGRAVPPPARDVPQGRRGLPDPILGLDWSYLKPDEPGPDELAREFNGKALSDLVDPANGMILAKAGEQLPGFALLRDDGSTASGCWIFAGSWTQQGNQMGRRDNSDPYGMGQTLGWAWAWPANRRILYNRASADVSGKPWDPEKKRLVWWNGKSWGGTDVPDYKADVPPEAGMNPFIMNPEGWLACSPSTRWPKARSRALRAVRDADRGEPLAPRQPQGDQQPGGTGVQERHGTVRHGRRVPLRSDHLPAHRALPLLDQALPAECDHPARAVRRDRRGAGQGAGHQCRRQGQGLLQPRLHQGGGGGDQAHPPAAGGRQDRAPRRHPDPLGLRRHGAQRLPGQHPDPFVGDGNTQTPEFKSFLVNVEKA